MISFKTLEAVHTHTSSFIKEEKGVTLVALAIMIVVITIIASVATYTGISTYHDMKVSAFQKKLSVIEEKVQTLKARAEEDKHYAQDLDNLTSCTDAEITKLGIITSDTFVDYNYKGNYKKITNNELQTKLGVHHIEGDYIVNFKTGEVFSLQGIEYENNTYYSNFQIEGKQDNGWTSAQRNWKFNYNGTDGTDGSVQEFIAPKDGYYKLECWGAQGGNDGGKGGYTSGIINLSEGQKLYVYVGGQGESGTSTIHSKGGYNGGGGNNNNVTNSSGNVFSAGGGGSTDIRLDNTGVEDFKSLASRIMVAAGGGGKGLKNLYGNAGGLDGEDAESYPVGGIPVTITGGTQTSGGKCSRNDSANGIFGIGGYRRNDNGDGGGGYYGGAGGFGYQASGAGGSSFISGHNGCDAIARTSTKNNIIHTGQATHYSGMIFTDTVMIDGSGYKWTTEKASTSEGMPTHDGTGTMTGNAGNGYAKITLVSPDNSSYVKDGLILHYDGIQNTKSGHDNSTTIWKDLSGNGNDGIIVGTDGTSESGWNDKYIQLDGVNDYVYCKTAIPGDNCTIEITAQYEDGIYMLRSNAGLRTYIYSDKIHKGSPNANKIYFGQNNYGNTSIRTMVFYNENNKNYFYGFYNGVKTNIVEFEDTTDGEYISIGSFLYYKWNQGCKEKVYSVRVYNRALTDDEVKNNYLVDKARFGIEE